VCTRLYGAKDTVCITNVKIIYILELLIFGVLNMAHMFAYIIVFTALFDRVIGALTVWPVLINFEPNLIFS